MPFQQRWIGFDGKPLTGVAPAQLISVNGRPISPAQFSEVAHHFKLFLDAVNVSPFPDGYHVQNRVLPDGTKVRMESMQRNARVFFEPPGGGDKFRIPHGFCVQSNWWRGLIYAKNTTIPTWSFKSDHVPQAIKDLDASNQTMFVRGTTGYPTPVVHSSEGRYVWDYNRHAGMAQESALPISLVSGDPHLHPCHFVLDNKITDAHGTTLYTMSPPSGSVTYLAGDSTPYGDEAILGAYSELYLTGDLYEVTTCSEAIKLDKSYELVERTDASFFTTAGNGPTTILDSTDYTLGITAEAEGLVWIRHMTYEGSKYGNSEGGTYELQYFIGTTLWKCIDNYAGGVFAWEFTDDLVEETKTVYESAISVVQEQADSDPHTISAVLMLPNEHTHEKVDITLSVAYPVNFNWRAGYITVDGDMSPPTFYMFYGVRAVRLYKREINRDLDFSPLVTLDTGLGNLKMLEGSIYERLRAVKNTREVYRESYTYPLSISYWRVTRAAEPGPNTPALPDVHDYDFGDQVTAYTLHHETWLANNANSEIDDIVANYVDGWTLSTDEEVPIFYEFNYDYTSRWIVDFDRKAKFWTAIKVRVQCEDARWDQAEGGFWGQLAVTTAPQYTVTIEFEWDWNGVHGLHTLATATCSRSPYEGTESRFQNPDQWPITNPIYDIVIKEPPRLGQSIKSIRQIKNLTNHQGVNECLAAEDQFGESMPFKSQDGIEYSYLNGNQEIPHHKYVTGQLYARTFKLSDFSDALWILTALKIDATENDNPLAMGATAWFYVPELGETISETEFHIELRDGIKVDWSDDLPDSDASPRPAKTDRQLRIHRI